MNKKKLILVLFLCFSLFANAQNTFSSTKFFVYKYNYSTLCYVLENSLNLNVNVCLNQEECFVLFETDVETTKHRILHKEFDKESNSWKYYTLSYDNVPFLIIFDFSKQEIRLLRQDSCYFPIFCYTISQMN
jgi:hypothetical protein